MCVCVKNGSPYDKSLHLEFCGWNFSVLDTDLKNTQRQGTSSCSARETLTPWKGGTAGVPTLHLHRQLAGSKRPGPDVHKMKPSAAVLAIKMETGVRDARALAAPRFTAKAKRRQASAVSLGESPSPVAASFPGCPGGKGSGPNPAPSRTRQLSLLTCACLCRPRGGEDGRVGSG